MKMHFIRHFTKTLLRYKRERGDNSSDILSSSQRRRDSRRVLGWQAVFANVITPERTTRSPSE